MNSLGLIPGRERVAALCLHVQTATGASQPSLWWISVVVFLDVQWLYFETDNCIGEFLYYISIHLQDMMFRCSVNLIFTCEIWGSHSGLWANPILLGCDAVSMCNIWKDHSTFFHLQGSVVQAEDSVDEDSKILWNINNYLPNNTWISGSMIVCQ